MSREVIVPNLNDLVRRYESGESLKSISDETQIGRGVLGRRFRQAGVDLRGRSEAERLKWQTIKEDPAMVRRQTRAASESVRRHPAPPASALQALSDAYTNGTWRAMCHVNGWSVGSAVLQLRAAGMSLRTQSEASRVAWANIKSTGRTSVFLQAAWDASRGRPKTEDELCRAAITRQVRRCRRGRHEDEVAERLRCSPWTVIQQRAVGHYNLDVALEEPRVAVKVYTSRPHVNGSVPLRKRLEYILDEGWVLLALRLWHRSALDGNLDLDAVTDHVLALAKIASGDESLRGQYRVIGRQGQTMTDARIHLDHRPVVGGA